MFNRPGVLLVVIVLLACSTLALAVFFVFRVGTQPTEEFTSLPNGVQNVTQVDSVASETSYVEFIAADNITIYFRDPRTFTGTTAVGGGMYQLTPILTSTSQVFGILFNEADASFAIGLEKEPLASARLQAEEYLRTQLGISNVELCELAIFVGVPSRVNQFYAGKNLGLSFCPGSVPLQ